MVILSENGNSQMMWVNSMFYASMFDH